MNGSGARFSANANAFLVKKEKRVNLKWYEWQFSFKKKKAAFTQWKIMHKVGK